MKSEIKGYSPCSAEIYGANEPGRHLSLCDKIICRDVHFKSPFKVPAVGITGYKCDEGVKRNNGRPGAVNGPDAIRKMLSRLADHTSNDSLLFDVGDVHCINGNMEQAQASLAELVSALLQSGVFPIVLGGGHDMAFGHYMGIRKYQQAAGDTRTIGIINLDAHFDLRIPDNKGNSGTPFIEIARQLKAGNLSFNYLCLGIRPESNSGNLYETAKESGTAYIELNDFHISYSQKIKENLLAFISKSDAVYLSVDLDGFSSAYAPGVSAAHPLGFCPDIAFMIIQVILSTNKLISLEIAEMNPLFDTDNSTAKLAASIVHAAITAICK